MRIFHPVTGQTAEVDDDAFTFVFLNRGWEPAPTDDGVPDEDLVVPHQPDQELTAKATLDAVGDDPKVAAAVLEAELAGKARKSLIAALERVISTQAEPATTEATTADSTEEPTP